MARQRRTFGPLFYSALVVGAFGMLIAAALRLNTGDATEAPGAEVRLRANVVALIPEVSSGDPGRRVEMMRPLGEALRGLAPVGENVAPYERALSALRGALHDPEAAVRAEAAETLGSLGSSARPAAAELTAALKVEEPEVQTAAARALLRIGGDVQAPALRVLAARVADPEPIPDREALVAAMQQAGDSGQDAVAQALASLLVNDDEAVRAQAVRCVAVLGPGGAPRIVPVLEPLFNASDPARRYAAAVAAMQLYDIESNPDPRVVTILAGVIGDASCPLKQRQDALTALYSFGFEGAGAMGIVEVAFPAGSPKPAALRQCGRALAKQLEHEDPEVRLAAAKLLQMIDPESLAGTNEEPADDEP